MYINVQKKVQIIHINGDMLRESHQKWQEI